LEFLTLIAFVCYYTIGAFLNLNFKNITIKKHGKKTIGVFKFGLNYKLQSLLINATINSTPYFSFLLCAYHNKNVVIYKIEFPFITELGIIIFAGFTIIKLSIVAAATKHQRHCTKKVAFRTYKFALVPVVVSARNAALVSSLVVTIFFSLEVISRKKQTFFLSSIVSFKLETTLWYCRFKLELRCDFLPNFTKHFC
jgi:hypothetical protein